MGDGSRVGNAGIEEVSVKTEIGEELFVQTTWPAVTFDDYPLACCGSSIWVQTHDGFYDIFVKLKDIHPPL